MQSTTESFRLVSHNMTHILKIEHFAPLNQVLHLSFVLSILFYLALNLIEFLLLFPIF